MPVEFEVQPFQNFLHGNHLVIGSAGVGKTRLLFSLLQNENFSNDKMIQIVLTDSQERLNQNLSPVPLAQIDPFGTDLRWIAEPSTPGIHFTSCGYIPRVTTFVECLANFVRLSEGNLPHPLRTFVDFSRRCWENAAFVEQFARLHYISESVATDEARPLSIWTVLTNLTDLPLEAHGMLPHAHLILMNPVVPSVLRDVADFLGIDLSPSLTTLSASGKDVGGFYYIPSGKEAIYYSAGTQAQEKSGTSFLK